MRDFTKSLLIRCDASELVGTGHLMRCLTLANEALDRGWKVVLIHRGSTEIIKKLSRTTDCIFFELSSGSNRNLVYHSETEYAHWLGVSQEIDAEDTLKFIRRFSPTCVVVDHYALDEVWHGIIRKECKNLLVIDDLGNRRLNCNFLLDQNVGADNFKYHTKLIDHTDCMFGPNFALCRKEFQQRRKASLNRRPSIRFPKNVLVTLGGADKENITKTVIEILAKSSASNSCKFTIVLGAAHQHRDELENFVYDVGLFADVLSNVTEMAKIMERTDLCIGAAGTTTWERCCMGIPTLMLVIANNQIEIANALHAQGLAILSNLEKIGSDFDTFFQPAGTSLMQKLTRKSQSVCDGKGVQRLLDLLEAKLEN